MYYKLLESRALRGDGETESRRAESSIGGIPRKIFMLVRIVTGHITLARDASYLGSYSRELVRCLKFPITHWNLSPPQAKWMLNEVRVTAGDWHFMHLKLQEKTNSKRFSSTKSSNIVGPTWECGAHAQAGYHA